MRASLNVNLQPTLSLSRRAGGGAVAVLVDESGRVLSDEAGNVLQPDPEVLTPLGDENNTPLKDENGNLIYPDP